MLSPAGFHDSNHIIIMKGPLSAGHLAVALLSLSPVVSALAWPAWLPDVDTLVVRQEDSGNNNNGTATPKTLHLRVY